MRFLSDGLSDQVKDHHPILFVQSRLMILVINDIGNGDVV